MTSMKRRQRNNVRSSSGVSLTELMVGSVLLGISIAVVAELMSLCVMANTKLFRQFDAQQGVNFALERIKKDVRMAREVRSQLSPKEIEELGQNRTLSSSSLILRLPIQYLSKSNDPSSLTYDASAAADPFNGFTIPGYYLVIYDLIPDPDNANEYRLVVTTRRMPKSDVYNAEYNWFVERSSFKSNVDAQVIAKGIIGPKSLGDSVGTKPRVFSYIAKNPTVSSRLDVLQDSFLFDQGIANGITEIGVDMEMRRGDYSGLEEPNESMTKVVAVHTETALRMPLAQTGPQDLTLYE